MLVTLAKAKTYLGITTSEYDSFLTEQLEILSDSIEGYCRRKFEVADYVQTFYFNEYRENRPSRELTLFHYPLNSVASVEVDGVVLDTSEYRLHSSGKLVLTDNLYWSSKFTNTLEVTYNAGLAATPSPIKSAIYTLISERYNKKKSGIDVGFGSDVQRLSVPGVMSIDFDYSLQANERKSTYGMILGNWVNVLDSYRSERALMGSVRLAYVV